jgi:hypothetical protein
MANIEERPDSGRERLAGRDDGQTRADKGLTLSREFEIKPVPESTIEQPTPSPQPPATGSEAK